jgi:hypothetical protein
MMQVSEVANPAEPGLVFGYTALNRLRRKAKNVKLALNFIDQ